MSLENEAGDAQDFYAYGYTFIDFGSLVYIMASQKETTPKSEQTSSPDLDSLLKALDGDLSAIDSDAAMGLIDQWYDSLHTAKEPNAKALANSLKHLKQLLKGGKATGHEIGETLSEIGEHTTEIADSADKDAKTPLQKLGKQLSKIGLSLGKAEDREHIEHIDSLIEKLGGDFSSIAPDAATGGIDEWYSLLHKSEDEGLKEIANGLKELKQVLKRKTAKGADIAPILTKLGEQTTAASAHATRGFKGPIQKLGKILTKAGNSFE